MIGCRRKLKLCVYFAYLASLLENELKEVEGLHDIRLELQSKREVSIFYSARHLINSPLPRKFSGCFISGLQELYEILMEALHKQIYSKPMTSVVQGFQRHGSMRASRERSDREKLLLKTALINSAAGASVQSSECPRLNPVSVHD